MRFKVNQNAPKEIMGRKPDKDGTISLTKKQAEYYLRNGHITEVDKDDDAPAKTNPAPATMLASPEPIAPSGKKKPTTAETNGL